MYSHLSHSGSLFGILPILEVNGKQLTGSTGIARMIAEQNGEKLLYTYMHTCMMVTHNVICL